MATDVTTRFTVRGNVLQETNLLVISTCFVASGATGLIYEILWARMLGLVFGATTFAVSAVLAAFMGGLALGSAVGGKFGNRLERPLRVYGLLELGIAIYALIVPFLFSGVDRLYGFIWSSVNPGFFGFNLLRFALSCAVLLLPTALMGATLPVLCSALTRTLDYTSARVARLYTCNLAGAVLGTLIAGFVLLPSLGVRKTILVAAAINALIGVAAIFVDSRGKRAVSSSGDIRLSEQPSEARDYPKPGSSDGARLWFFAAAVSGFVTISTQVAWTRLLTMIIGSSTYAFSLVVALFLIGLALGAFVTGKTRSETDIRRLLFNAEIGTAISFVFSLWITNQIPTFLLQSGLKWQVSSWMALLALQVIASAMLILFPAFLMGLVMPLVLVWAGNAGGQSQSVFNIGRGYAINTLGAIAGAWATAFVLIPVLSTRSAILISATLCLVVACCAYTPRRNDSDVDLHRSLAVGLTAAIVLGLFIFAPMMNKLDLSLGAYDTVIRVLARSQFGGGQAEEEKRGEGEHRVLMFEEGPTATVSVRQDWKIISMAVNGRTNASDSVTGDMPTQVMLAQLPMLLAPKIDKGLVVGFGSGVSVGSLLQSEMKSLECVELERTAVDAGRFFEHVNNKPLADPRLRVIIDDARTYLRVTPNKYDVIVSEPSHPWVPGVANLFTKDFFEMGRERLSDEGVFVQWVQIYQLSTDSLRSVLGTYQKVFPHVLMFRVAGKGKDLILLGSNHPLNFDHLEERLKDPRISADIARVNLHSSGDIMEWFVCDELLLAPALSGAEINTDDNMLVENRVPREAFKPSMESNGAWIDALAVRSRGQ
jgi:spermidine synthase